MLGAFLTPQFRRFLLTGAIAASVNIGCRIVLNRWTSYSVAIVLAYACGTATAFWLSRRFVFVDSTRTAAESIPRFVAVNLVGVAQTWAVSLVLAVYALPRLGFGRYAPAAAHFIGVAAPVFTSFVGHSIWTFADRPAAPSTPPPADADGPASCGTKGRPV